MSLTLIATAIVMFFNILGVLGVFELLVYNEEAIIVICFILFLSFAYKTIGVSVTSDLDDRALKVRDELVKSITLWQRSQGNIVESWNLVLSVSKQVDLIFSWSKIQIEKIIDIRLKNFPKSLEKKITSRLNSLASQEQALGIVIQNQLVSDFFEHIDKTLWRNLNTSGSDIDSELLYLNTELLNSSPLVVKRACLSQISESSVSFALEITILEMLIIKLV